MMELPHGPHRPQANRRARRRRGTTPSAASGAYDTYVPTAAQVAAGAAGGAALVLAAQAAYVAWNTPRLSPPDQSGHDFEPDGLLVVECDDACKSRNQQQEEDREEEEKEEEEFRVVLLGDSPVEGIGNDDHGVALGGQTALAFSRSLRRPVRYWSLGKSGLTAEGIEKEMVPLLKRAAEKYDIDAVVISCGVNNVLWGQTAGAFGKEVHSLLDAVMDCCGNNRATTTIMLLGLLDFSHMPFLPWPLSSVAGWRSRALQKTMEEVVEERQQQMASHGSTNHGANIVIAHIPEVEHLLDSDSRHPLLDHLDHEVIPTLEIDDFFADDGFHPAKNGTTMLGNLLARTYDDIVSCDPIRVQR